MNDKLSEHLKCPDKFKGTGWIDDAELRIQISKQISDILSGQIEVHFQLFQVLGYNFLLKESDIDSRVPPHQDWTYVDESKYYSFNLWLALEDILPEDGAIQVLPFSHRIFSGYLRPSPAYPIPFAAYRDKLLPFMKTIPMRAGDCICFSNAVVHASLPNTGRGLRPVVVCTIYPKEATLLHHYVHNISTPNEVVEYHISSEQFLKINRGQPPQCYINKHFRHTRYPDITYQKFVLIWYAQLYMYKLNKVFV
ncbi:MAG: phytanoyl-CoA dioxygenase family protein [Chitinophagales bacterium]|nr:phytanoyl-CoA dioxygenase family protein [Chitinophagales bacterium]MDW8417803.1 phytanoyl-CoA dioxygenase family protein [Chitinophagales bacterium]